MPDKEIAILELNVHFNACAAYFQGVIQWHRALFIIVRMARDRDNSSAETRWPLSLCFAGRAWGPPSGKDALDVILWYEASEMENQVDEGGNQTARNASARN